jgi:hypothetical protein
MGRPKGARNKAADKSPKKKQQHQDPMIDEIVEIEVEFDCPVKGKVKQKVKMKRLKSIKDIMKAQVNIDGIDSIDKDTEIQAYDENTEE